MNPIVDDKQVAMAHLVVMLSQLKVFRLRMYTFSHMATMMGSLTGMIKPHWIPVPTNDLKQQFLEIVGRSDD